MVLGARGFRRLLRNGRTTLATAWEDGYVGRQGPSGGSTYPVGYSWRPPGHGTLPTEVSACWKPRAWKPVRRAPWYSLSRNATYPRAASAPRCSPGFGLEQSPHLDPVPAAPRLGPRAEHQEHDDVDAGQEHRGRRQGGHALAEMPRQPVGRADADDEHHHVGYDEQQEKRRRHPGGRPAHGQRRAEDAQEGLETRVEDHQTPVKLRDALRGFIEDGVRITGSGEATEGPAGWGGTARGTAGAMGGGGVDLVGRSSGRDV